MIDDKTIKKLSVREMIRCEVTGKLVPIEDCEVVVIKIIKAKDADLNNFNPFGSTSVAKTEDVPFIVPKPKVVPNGVPASHRDSNILTEEDVTRAPKTRSIIPPQFASMMLDPSHPQFESRGAKVSRRVG